MRLHLFFIFIFAKWVCNKKRDLPFIDRNYLPCTAEVAARVIKSLSKNVQESNQ